MKLQMPKGLKSVRLDRNAIRITALYWLIGGLWIVFSDKFAEAISRDEQTLTIISISKGWFYVLVTGLLLYWLIHRNNSNLQGDKAELQAAEKNYKDIFDNATVGIFRSTPDGRFININLAMAKIYGYDSPEEMVAEIKNISKQIYANPEERRRFREPLAENGKVVDFIGENLRKDGTKIWTSTNARAVKDQAGRIIYYEGFIEDITERKQIEEELSESEERYKLMFEQAPLAINITHNTIITYANPAYLKMFGFSSLDELQSVGPLELFTPEWRPRILENIQRRIEGLPVPNYYEAECLRKDGTKFPILMYLTSLRFSTEPATLGFILDITERKLAEENLRVSESNLKLFIEHTPASIAMFDRDMKYVSVSQRYLSDYRLPGQNIIGRSHYEVLPEIPERWREIHKRCLAGATEKADQDSFLRADGTLDWTRWEICPWYERSGEIGGIILFSEVITKRKQAEEALQQAEEKYHNIFKNAMEGIFQSTTEGKFITANPALAHMLGYDSPEELIASVNDINRGFYVQPARRAEFTQRLSNHGQLFNFESEVYRKDGNTIWISENAQSVYADSGHLLHHEGTLIDITERKRAEEELRNSELRYRDIFEGVQDAIIVEGKRGKILDVNQRACEIFGYPRDVFLTKNVRDLVPSEKIIVPVSENETEVREARPVEVINIRAGGERFPAELSTRSLTLGNQRVLLVILRDITGRKAVEENLHQRLEELELIYQSGLELSQILEPEEIARKVLDQLKKRLNWQNNTIRLYDAESRTLRVIAFDVPGMENEIERQGIEAHFNNIIQKPEDGLSGWAIQLNQTLRVGDVIHDPHYVEAFPGLKSGIYVPIKTANRIIGVITVESESSNAFSESDERLVSTLAGQAAIALENSRLHKETAQQLEQLQALHFIDLAITNTLDLNISLDILINQVVEQLGVDAAAILVLEPEIDSLKCISSKGFRTHLLENASQNLSLNGSLAGQAIFERRTIVSQVAQAPNDVYKEIWMAEGFYTVYSIPLLTKGDPKGVMNVFFRSEVNAGRQGWMEFLETVSRQAAIAIENIHLFEALKTSNIKLGIAYDATIEGWSRAMDLRDQETEDHTKRVVQMTLKLAADFDFSGEMLMHIRRGVLLHDIGKLGVPDSILLKPDKLTDEEWVIMKKHPTFALEMLSPIQYLNRAINIPYCHHEKWDGTGYPRGLSREQIPLEARIFAIVDVWDALLSDRPYRKAWTKERALEHIQSVAGTHFDPQIVEVFLKEVANENK